MGTTHIVLHASLQFSILQSDRFQHFALGVTEAVDGAMAGMLPTLSKEATTR